jgi:hypothetical protein
MMTEVIFIDDGEGGWDIEVNGKRVANIRKDETNVADLALQPLWDELEIDLEFDEAGEGGEDER